MTTQTLALLLDAYRELRARKLFWIVLVLSLIFVGAFAAIGINDKGLTILVWDFPVPLLNMKTLPSKGYFYKLMFVTLGFQFWLTWAATILALISTAGIIPDFVSSGSIELSLSKPIGRLRLFLTKYATGLLFVAIQVALFSAASFLVIGIRGSTWEPAIFLAIPLVLLFFSFLYCVSALVGLLWRSTIAALLCAGLFWFFIMLVQTSEVVFLQQRIFYDKAADILRSEAADLETKIATIETKPPAPGDAPDAPDAPDATQAPLPASNGVDVLRTRLDDVHTRLKEAERDQVTWTRVHAIGFAVKTVVPKTKETMGLLERWLLSLSDMESFADAAQNMGPARDMASTVHGVRVSQRYVTREIERELHDRSEYWILGTSVAFEAAVLALSAWIFCRRDF